MSLRFLFVCLLFYLSFFFLPFPSTAQGFGSGTNSKAATPVKRSAVSGGSGVGYVGLCWALGGGWWGGGSFTVWGWISLQTIQPHLLLKGPRAWACLLGYWVLPWLGVVAVGVLLQAGPAARAQPEHPGLGLCLLQAKMGAAVPLLRQ